MAAVGEAYSTLASKCMDFCQALASQGQVFNFSLSVGPTFSFSLDTTRSKAPLTKKKASPSTLRRNARRREEFNAKKQHNSSTSTEMLPSPEKERCPEATGGLQMSPTRTVQREENALSEQEGASSPTGKPPSPLPVAPSPPFQEDCYFTTDWTGRNCGPKCDLKFNCEREFRRHAHKAHGCSLHLLEYLKDCKCPECWDSLARRRLRPEFDSM